MKIVSDIMLLVELSTAYGEASDSGRPVCKLAELQIVDMLSVQKLFRYFSKEGNATKLVRGESLQPFGVGTALFSLKSVWSGF